VISDGAQPRIGKSLEWVQAFDLTSGHCSGALVFDQDQEALLSGGQASF
jgi:hypothetical protein